MSKTVEMRITSASEPAWLKEFARFECGKMSPVLRDPAKGKDMAKVYHKSNKMPAITVPGFVVGLACAKKQITVNDDGTSKVPLDVFDGLILRSVKVAGSEFNRVEFID